MLVLTAKLNDRIDLIDSKTGNKLGEILIVHTADSRVRVGIDLPKDIRIERRSAKTKAERLAAEDADHRDAADRAVEPVKPRPAVNTRPFIRR